MSIFSKQDRLNKSLLNTIFYSRDAEAARKKIDAGADVNGLVKHDYDRAPMIWWAADRGTADIVSLLLEKGADPNPKTGYRRTPLMEAVDGKSVDKVRVLVKAGALVNVARDYDGETALIMAAKTGSADIVKILIEAGADVNAQLKDGNTALHLAAAQGYANLCAYLVEKGANAELENCNMNTPANVAEKEYPVLAELIRGKAPSPVVEPLPPAAPCGWKIVSPDEIALVTTKDAIGYRVTEVFNFTARTYVHIASNLDTHAESQSVKSFAELEGSDLIAQARDELLRRGGRPDEAALKKKLQAPST